MILIEKACELVGVCGLFNVPTKLIRTVFTTKKFGIKYLTWYNSAAKGLILMFGIGMGEFVLILIVGLIIFGPKNLPEVGKALGKGLKEFRKAQAALSATLEESVNETPKKSESKPAEVSLEKNSESVKISTDEKFKAAKENPNAEMKSAEISLEKNSELAKISTDENSIPKEIYTGTAKVDTAEKSEPARISVDDLISSVKENPISNTPADEKISKEKTA